MPLKCRVALVGFAAATVATTAAAWEPAKTETKPRLLNLPEVVKVDDYPPEALRKHEQGTAHMRLTIDPDGRVTGCTVEKSSGSSALDATSCRIYSDRARLEPVASDGKPRVSREKVRWQLGSGRSRQGWFLRMTMAIKTDGSVASCRVESSEAPDTNCWTPEPFSPQLAANYVKHAGYDPARLVTEIRFYPEGETPEEPMSGQLFSRRAAKVVVQSDGTLRNCDVLEADLSAKSGDSVCREASQYGFEPLADAPDATGIIRFWTYLEPKPGQ